LIITTTKGDMDTSLLEHRPGFIDNDIEYTTWDEYYLRRHGYFIVGA